MSAIQEGVVSILGMAAAATILFSPPAHAEPWPSPHCDVSSRTYDSRMCSDLPQNDTNCTPYGDSDQCMSDWLDYQRQEHNYYQPPPN
jgi:hypothetical protein